MCVRVCVYGHCVVLFPPGVPVQPALFATEPVIDVCVCVCVCACVRACVRACVCVCVCVCVCDRQVVMGKTMEEWLRFSVCFWHTFRGTGETALSLSLSLSLIQSCTCNHCTCTCICMCTFLPLSIFTYLSPLLSLPLPKSVPPSLPSLSPGADPFGYPTLCRPWEDGSGSMTEAKRRLRAAFEFFSKLGVKYWTFHDRYMYTQCMYSVHVHACTLYIHV